MEIFNFIINSCTSKDTDKKNLIYLLNYIYQNDKGLIITLEKIKKLILIGDSVLVIEGLYNILLKDHKKAMFEFSSHWKVKKYLQKNIIN